MGNYLDNRRSVDINTNDNNTDDIDDNVDTDDEYDTDDDSKRDPRCGYCPKCKKANTDEAWCTPCDRKALVDKFNTWSTGNEYLDLFIQETQRNSPCYDGRYSYLEYVPYNRFVDVKSFARGGFAEMFTATWLDGWREAVREKDGKENRGSWVKGRSEPFTVALKMFYNSAKMEQSFVDELRLRHELYMQKIDFACLGFTQDPETMNCALILSYLPEGDLRKSFTEKKTWGDKLWQLERICGVLEEMHDDDYIHCDIHSGNVLIRNLSVYLTDFGLARPADSPRSTKEGTHGVIPYMAPELFRGEPHSKASDIYAVGIIMSEIASNELAFCDRGHDVQLQLEIIDGLRPEVPPETPRCYKKLMDRCLSGDPLKRPTAKKIVEAIIFKWDADMPIQKGGNTAEAKQFRIADKKQWQPRQLKKRHPDAIYTSRLIPYVTTDKE